MTKKNNQSKPTLDPTHKKNTDPTIEVKAKRNTHTHTHTHSLITYIVFTLLYNGRKRDTGPAEMGEGWDI